MIFYYNLGGELISYFPESVYQGSNLVNTIYFVAPIASGNLVGVSFTLPDGTTTQRLRMNLASDFNGEIIDGDDNEYSFYEYKLPFNITKNYGSCSLQFSVYTQNGNEILTTESVAFIIEKGVYNENANLVDPLSKAIDYFNNEMDTGSKWIDGKSIYKTTLTTTVNVTAGTAGYINSTLLIPQTNKNLIKAEGICKFNYSNVNVTIPLNTYFSRLKKLNYSNEVYVNFYKSDKFVIEYNLPVSSAELTFTYFYTKI